MSPFFSSLRRFAFLAPYVIALPLVPFLVLPWFVDAYEVHKATVVILAGMLAGMLFLARALREHVLHVRWSFATLFLLFFFGATLLSACFSQSAPTSWLGLGGGDYASVLFIGACALTSFLLSQAREISLFLQRFVRVTWGTGALVTCFLLFGIWVGIFSLSPVLSFGMPHTLAFFVGAASFLWIGTLSERSSSVVQKVFSSILFCGLFFVAFFLDAWVLWVPLFVTGMVFLSLLLAHTQGAVRLTRVMPAVLIIVLSLVGWLLPHLFQGLFPAEIVPSFSLSLAIVKSVWSTGIGFFFGSGSGTYGISYALHALPAVNATLFWNVVFERGFSYVFTLATTMGIFGVFSFIGLQVTGLLAGFRAWSQSEKESRGLYLGTYLAFLFLSLSAWTYSWSVDLTFATFVLLGLLLAAAPQRERTWALASSLRTSVLASFGFVSSLVALSLIFFIAGTRYAAEISYAQAIALEKKGATPEDVLAKVDRAASFNGWNDVYYRELSILLLQRIEDLVAAQAPSDQVQAVLGSAVNAAVRATEIGPNVVANWEVRGNVYREVAPAVSGAADFSIASFTTAIKLSPVNPVYFVGLGRAYLTKADLLLQATQTEDEARKAEVIAARNDALAQAEHALLSAIALKSDYAAARYFLSAVYERQDKLVEAVQSMEAVRASHAEDIGVGMQLALLYLRQGKNDLAQAELERIIALSPTYANARWYLSVILEQEGDIAGALAQIAEVLKSNPDNEAVQQRLNRLQSGQVQDDVATVETDIPDPLSEEPLGDAGGVVSGSAEAPATP